jgi:hypothetical protein
MTQSSGVSDSMSSEYTFPFTVSATMEPSLFIPSGQELFGRRPLCKKVQHHGPAASLHRCLCQADFYAVLRSTPAYRADMGRPLEMHWISKAARGTVHRLTEFLQHEPNG